MSSPQIREIVPISNALAAHVTVPGSKSYTNRALCAAGLAKGASKLTGALFSDDTTYMSRALNALGMKTTGDAADRTFVVEGVDGQVPDKDCELFVGNAGTAARFLTATLATGKGRYTLDGVQRMRERPMKDLLQALRGAGVEVDCAGKPDCFPATISGRFANSGPYEFVLPGNASSQFISGLLLAAPAFGDRVRVTVKGELVSKPYLDMTERVMRSFGVEMINEDYAAFEVASGAHYSGCDYAVEPDASAASYFFAAAAICGGTVSVEGLGTSSLQGDLGIVQMLEQMGARVSQTKDRTTVTGSGSLRGIEVNMKDLSDVAQTLAVVAPFASSPTRISGIGFIRNKETDRVGNVVRELRRLGIRADEEADGYVVHPGSPTSGTVETYDDHRMAMSFALLGLKQPGIRIQDPGCTSKTFPDYFEVLETLRG